MKQKQIIETIIKHRIIAIVRGASKDNILEIAEALYKGGIRLLEITFPYRMSDKYQQTSDMIQMVVKEFSDKLYVGAGTVMTTECVELAERAGAGFIISPDTNPDVIEKTKHLGLVSIPGAYTPTEIAKAISAGADFVKLFPRRIRRLFLHKINPFTAERCQTDCNWRDRCRELRRVYSMRLCGTWSRRKTSGFRCSCPEAVLGTN